MVDPRLSERQREPSTGQWPVHRDQPSNHSPWPSSKIVLPPTPVEPDVSLFVDFAEQPASDPCAKAPSVADTRGRHGSE